MQNLVLKVVTISLVAVKISDALLDKSTRITNSECANGGKKDSVVRLGMVEPTSLVLLKLFRYFTSMLNYI